MAPARTQAPPPDLVSHVKVSQTLPDSVACLGCGVLSDKTVSTIPCQADWPVSFPLQSAVKLVACGP